MTERDWAVLLHLAGVVLIFSGASLAGAAHAGARRLRRRPGHRQLPGRLASLEAGRFHRVFAATLVALAAALGRHHDPPELAVLGTVFTLTTLVGRHLVPGVPR
jgi:hypothetical protein